MKRNIFKKIIMFVLLAVLAFSLTACKTDEVTSGPGALNTPFTDALKLEKDYEGKDFLVDGIGLVSKPVGVDGDTARFQTESSSLSFPVRFLGINTPESTANLAPWGVEASEYCKKILKEATEVVLEAATVGQKPTMDTNGTRYLGYVWYRNSKDSDFRLLNMEMIEQCFTYHTGSQQETYGKEMQKAFEAAYKLTIEDAEGNITKVGVFGQKSTKYDYSTKITEITIAELRNNYSSYSTGSKLKMQVRVVRSIGKSLFVEDIEETLNEETGVKSRGAIFMYYSYKINKNYAPGTILTLECQASETDEYGKQLVNPSSIRSKAGDANVQLTTIDNTITSLEAFEGFVVEVNNFKITSIGNENPETGAYTIYGEMENGSELMVRIDGDCTPKLKQSSEYLQVGARYNVIGGVSRYTDPDGVTVFQIKLGNFNDTTDFQKVE